jgi:adenine phosphoribosyltransferase
MTDTLPPDTQSSSSSTAAAQDASRRQPTSAAASSAELTSAISTLRASLRSFSDFFQMQEDAIKEGQKVLVVDDIIATGGSAKAAADLVQQCKGSILGFLFILEIPGLNGQEKLGGLPTTILIENE